MTYFFVLGRNPQLSLAELYATLPKGWQPLIFGGQILVAECREFDVDVLMKRLGGTIKIGKVLENSKQKIENRILDLFTAKTDNKKLFFGLSAYALDEKVQLPNVRQMRQLGIEIKRVLQTQGHRVRLVTSKEIALSSVIVKQEKLLTQGAEIVMLYNINNHNAQSLIPNTYNLAPQFIGQTRAVQEFGEASARDFGRPARSMGVGMLPIQLTKIMLNLSRAPKEAIVLDPFCGLGTVLTEAAQMGYTHLIGSDLEQTMIDATRENLKWLTTQKQSFSVSAETENVPDIKLFASSVEELSKHLSARSVDAIVTEPYMGPTRGIMNYESGIMDELVKLYISAFREFSKILKPSGHVVFIFPAFRSGAQLTKTSDQVLPQIKKLGFTPTQLLPTHTSYFMLHDSQSITYSRPDQKVLREIFLFEYQNAFRD